MLEPLCLVACALYAVNRWGVKPHVASPFLRGHFNDLLMIPCALPLLLWIQRRLGLRTHDRFPSISEIALHLGVWAVIAEFVGPRWLHHGVGDPWDVVAYTIGTIGAALIWRVPASKDLAPNEPRVSQ
jgi:hypothetical protein